MKLLVALESPGARPFASRARFCLPALLAAWHGLARAWMHSFAHWPQVLQKKKPEASWKSILCEEWAVSRPILQQGGLEKMPPAGKGALHGELRKARLQPLADLPWQVSHLSCLPTKNAACSVLSRAAPTPALMVCSLEASSTQRLSRLTASRKVATSLLRIVEARPSAQASPAPPEI